MPSLSLRRCHLDYRDRARHPRGAIGSHSTATTDEAWDAGANEARMRDGETSSYYRKMFACVDPDKAAATKAAYKFPHHQVAEGGEVGAANTNGCSAGIAVLNGGRGGADIPTADRSGIHAHLAKHIADAGKEAPELKFRVSALWAPGSRPQRERRITNGLRMETRAAGDNPARKVITGHAARFDSPASIYWWCLDSFEEVIRKGAFARTIGEADVRALFNHDPNFVLGRNKAGTLRLREDDIGLAIEVDPPPAVWAQDLVASIERGDITQMSFAFRPIKETWTKGENDKPDLREILEVDLDDVSPVTYPAYEDTDVQVVQARSAPDLPGLPRALRRLSFGIDLDKEDAETLESYIATLRGTLKKNLPRDNEEKTRLLMRLRDAECELETFI